MPSIAIVGAGPRGISLVERLAAHLRATPLESPLHLHIIDDAPLGAGRIWDTEQTRTLCMNTLAGAVTLFTEPSSTTTAPVLEGPILYEWIQLLRGERPDIAPAKLELYDSHPPREELAASFAEELARTRPESNPSRALYGAYLEWVFEVALTQLPETVDVVQHRARALSVEERGEQDAITLSDGSTVTADATVLAYGWQVPALSESERALAEAAHSDLHWVRPDNPVEQPVSEVPAGEKVLIRGLGMGFFDIMALLTIDRGGEFVGDPSTRSGLRYEPSGEEPHFIVSSGRGYPYIPKSEYHALPPKAALTRFRAAVAALVPEVELDFGTQLLPHILRDAYAEYYENQARVAPDALQRPLADIIATIDATVVDANDLAGMADQLTAALEGSSAQPLDLAHWANPLDDFTDGEITEYIAEGLARDIIEAVAAADSPLKSALWAISAARKPSSIAGSEGRMTWESRTSTYKEFMAFGQMVGSGPPLFRTRQLLALVDAGLVTFLGQRPQLEIGEKFTLRTAHGEASSTWLIDAWMHSPDVRRAGDPLAVSLNGRVRAFVDHGQATGSPETTWNRRVVNPGGIEDPRLHIVGIPTYSQWPDTTISPMPGTDPLMLQETDRTAGSLLNSL
ncbi:exopolyphosphatase [Corynebacterium sp. HMSC062E11]|uniref:FAD/NAD(P)-binding protein n=1 Tax=Corynebacterium TaxID=1716 RepID=UPI0008A492EC|nr:MULTISPECIES: FAD/NAD(P)-binding protein [unclassified Corynebacterium]MDK6808400.1 FAD/NAD(P)-binding protein [Corynebacterium aurimucosum]NJJ84300.1 FAD/NAD(P)-binding protein [Corynebacterium aurimucosum]OFK26723.1 exopolyphosphatase [Corynebacterium sp. HMSC062E11]OFK62073.1 exopolyphosphatase [Corynebacterium sp. HMSC078A10]OFL59551.1 exopolyphosphatase [Corynebacterium sp. HMSC065D07]